MVNTRKPGPGKLRLDKLLVERGLCESRTRAQAVILAGEVVVGAVNTRPTGGGGRNHFVFL